MKNEPLSKYIGKNIKYMFKLLKIKKKKRFKKIRKK